MHFIPMLVIYHLVSFLLIWMIVRMMAGTDVSEYKVNFAIFLVMSSSVLLALAMKPPTFYVERSIYLACSVIGMRMTLGTTWLGAVVGATCYVLTQTYLWWGFLVVVHQGVDPEFRKRLGLD